MSATIPEATTARLLGNTNAIARRMTRRIAKEYVLGARFQSVGYLRAITQACREALTTLLQLLSEGRGLRPADVDKLGAMGAREAENGIPLEVLLGAYRIAARVLWEEFISEGVQRNELPPATVVTATSYVLEYFDLISSAVGRAYLETRDRLVLQQDRERERILQRILAGDVPPEAQHLAAAVDLDLQPPYRVMACPTAAASTKHAEWQKLNTLLVPTSADVTIVLLPVRHDTQAKVRRFSEWGQLALGPIAVTLNDISEAARVARETLDVGRVLNPTATIHRHGDYSPFTVLRRENGAMRAFVEHQLGFVEKLSPKRRSDSLQTLQAVIDTPTLADAAAHLGIHRHTLVYRIEKLTEQGLDLQDAENRHMLWLALRLKSLLPPD